MSFGESLLSMMGVSDPRLKLLQSVAGGLQGTPAGAASTPAAAGRTQAGVGTAPGTGGPAGATGAPGAPGAPMAPVATPTGMESPSDLASMYKELITYNNKVDSINRGIGLIGASFAHPENRQAIMSAFGGGSGGGGGGLDPSSIINSVMELNKYKIENAQRAAMLAALPSIAKQYGMSIETATYLMNTGQLDEVISKLAVPDTQVVTDGQGIPHLVDMSTGKVLQSYGNAKTNTTTITDAQGVPHLVDATTGKEISTYGSPKVDTQIVADPVTGQSIVVDKTTGKPINTIGNAKANTATVTDAQGVPRLIDTQTGKEISSYGSPKLDTDVVTDPRTGQPMLIDKQSAAVKGVYGSPRVTTEIRQGPDGSSILVDPAASDPSKAYLGQVAGPDTQTSDTRDYAAYVKDEASRGNNSPQSFQQWRMTKPPTSAVSVNNDLRAEGSFAKTYGEQMGKRLDKLVGEGETAATTLQNLDLVQKALESGVRTGSFGETELSLRKFGQLIGVNDANDPKVTGGELIQKVTNQMALFMRNPDSGMGMPGSVSDRDLQFLKDSQLGLSTSPEGNKATLEAFRRIYRRKIEVAEMAEQWAEEHNSMIGFNKYVRQYAEEHPLFEDFKVSATADEEKINSILDKYK